MPSRQSPLVLSGVLLDEQSSIGLAELCRSAGLHAEQIIAMVEEGLLEPVGKDPHSWRFTGMAVRRVHIAVHLQRDLQVNLSGAALALELLDEIRELRRRLEVLQSELTD
ncbi:MAG: chaperone modulator CbpM [Gammaproteobacteria bacterium]